jgi:hypothetical protein
MASRRMWFDRATRAILAQMPGARSIAPLLTAPLCAALLTLGCCGTAGAAAVTRHDTPSLRSPLLWATIDACNPPDQPDTIGVRGSMPGDGSSAQEMYMRFELEYRDPVSGLWTAVADDGDSGFVAVGSARYRFRQAGQSFQFSPAAGASPYRLRGMVSFRWQRGTTVLRTVTLYTSPDHDSGAVADPAGDSSATCVTS